MFVGIVRIELHLPASRSLKDKRSIVRGLVNATYGAELLDWEEQRA
jgi:uncharacterized protein YlxP (DUF503 family)